MQDRVSADSGAPKGAEPESDLEVAVRRLCAEGRYDRAASELIRGLGPQVLGHLVRRTGNLAHGEEVFAMVCEQVWRRLPGQPFHEHPIKRWFYLEARSALWRFRKAEGRHGRGATRLSQAEHLLRAVSSATVAYRRAEEWNALRALVGQLPPDDQALLGLRHKPMSWSDVALTLLGDGGEPPERETLTKLEVALRQRYAAIKKKLKRALAAERAGAAAGASP